MVTRPRLWLKTTSEKGPHLSCVVSHGSGAFSALEPVKRKPFSRLRSKKLVLRLCLSLN